VFGNPRRTVYRLTESGAGVVVTDGDGSGGCSVSGQVARCSTSQVTQTEIALNTGDDKAANSTSLRGIIIGGRGVDSLVGGSGPDLIAGQGEADTFTGGAGDDQLVGDQNGHPEGDDTFHGGPGADAFQQGSSQPTSADLDTVNYSDRTVAQTVDLDGSPDDGDASDQSGGTRDNVGGGMERILGGTADDRLTGDGGANRLEGRDGNDILNGLAGPDALFGSLGNDVFVESAGPSGPDVYNGGKGGDTLNYGARSGPVAVRLDGSANDGFDPDQNSSSSAAEEHDQDVAIEDATTGSGDDFLLGSAAANLLGGRAGNDRLHGQDGTARVDELRCGDGADDRSRSDPSDTLSSCEDRCPPRRSRGSKPGAPDAISPSPPSRPRRGR
jgi:Ca2+-binding RTX toxin-like protein